METTNSVLFKLKQNPSTYSTAITEVGALDAGSITSGFGSINIGSDALTAGAGSFTTLAASGATNLDAGTVGLPGLYFEGDTTTGVYRIGANNLGVSVSASKVLDIASTGLTITGTTTSGSFIPTSTTVPTNGMFLGAANSVSIATNSTEHWMVNASGNLNPVGSKGIGTTIAPVAGVVSSTLELSSYIEGTEEVAPSAPAANKFRLFAQDNGAGKTQLMVQFATGAAIQLAIEA